MYDLVGKLRVLVFGVQGRNNKAPRESWEDDMELAFPTFLLTKAQL